ncbi:MAG: TolC family outer membrane protein [Spongiibacteraceae bacterium]
MKSILKKLAICCLLTPFSLSTLATTEVISEFEQAIKHAIVNNPGVQASFHAYRAAGHELRSAKGGYLPRVDLSSEFGETTRETPTFPEDSYLEDNTRLTLTQMLFDGFATWHRSGELSHAQRAAYYELMRTAEEVALEAAQAYHDVVRYQALVVLAELNLEEHMKIYQHVEQRADAGVSRGVDLEQANARLALADFNLLQDVTNLHDVVTRFQRVVTAMPSQKLMPPSVTFDNIPGTRDEALGQAYDTSPLLQKALATLAAANSAAKARKSRYFPKLDLRLRAEQGHDIDGLFGRHDERAAELVLTYNLYNGGSDRAARKQFTSRRDEAFDLRVKACHDVRQNLLVAYNDIDSVTRKLVFLLRNEQSIEKARIAYRKQFDIGQRTLLDLLDSENEYFDVSRSVVSSEQDLAIARLRTLATMGLLTRSIGADSTLPGSKFKYENAGCPMDSGLALASYYNRKEPSLLDNLRAAKQDTYRIDVRFAFDSDNIDASYDKDLKDTAQYLTENPTIRAQIHGHTDSVGTENYNQGLSLRRASAVRHTLIKTYGIKADRLEAIGHGESEPLAENSTRVGRAQNRRVELRPLKN